MPADERNAFFIRPGRCNDALAILEAHRSSVRGTAARAYSAEVLDSWAPVSISADRIAAVMRYMEASVNAVGF